MPPSTDSRLGSVHLLLRLGQILYVATVEMLRGALRGEPWVEPVYRTVVRLGPTGMKLGQIASTRPDLVPETLAVRLSDLQERAPQFPLAAARQVIEEDLGPVESLFSNFPRNPAAAASLSQVYFATLRDGTPVAVKVQRPNIALPMRRDILLLRWVARFMTFLRPSLRPLQLEHAAEEFGRWSLEELDFQQEAENAETFRRNFRERSGILFPKIYWDYTSQRVLTMERVAGLRLHEVDRQIAPNARRRVVEALSQCLMRMFVTDGFFHADLHPGNVFFTLQGEVILLDLGMVGRLTRADRDRFLVYWVAITRRQRERAFHHLLHMGHVLPGADLVAYEAVYNEYLDAFYASGIGERGLARTYLDIFSAGARFKVTFPSRLLLQAKAILTMESLARTLMPDFRFADSVRPVVAEALAAYARAGAVRDAWWRSGAEWLLLDETVGLGALADPDSEDERAFRRAARDALLAEWAGALDRRLREWGKRVANPRYGDTSPAAREREVFLKQLLRAVRIGAQLLERVGTGPEAMGQSGRTRIDGDDEEGRARWHAFRAQTRRMPPAAFGMDWDGEPLGSSTDSSWRLDPWERTSVLAALAALRFAVARFHQSFEELITGDELIHCDNSG